LAVFSGRGFQLGKETPEAITISLKEDWEPSNQRENNDKLKVE
jgi:hypothetical protein